MKKEIQIFKPGIAELTNLAEKYKDLEIKDVKDKKGYNIVYNALRDLSKTRIKISNFGMSQRREARDYASEVIKQEKSLLNIIVPIENILKDKRKKIDDEKKLEERKVLLPSRKNLLNSIEVELDDEDILGMDEKTFAKFFEEEKLKNDETKSYVKELEDKRKADEKRYKAAEEKAKLDAAKKAKQDAIDAAKKAEDDKKKALKDAADKAEADKLKAAKEKEDAIKKVKQDAAAEKQAILDEQKRKDKERKDEEDRLKREKANKIIKENIKKEKTEKNNKYKKWLKDNNFNSMNHIINRSGNSFIMYREVSSIIIE